MFFALSGFLLFLPYGRVFTADTMWPSTKRFYLQRARRILPMYGVILLGIALALLHDHTFQIIPYLVTSLMFHDTYAPAWWGVAAAKDAAIWSLAVEWQFYLLLPLIALGLRVLHRRFGMRGVILGLISLVVYGMAIRSLSAIAHYVWGWPDPILPLIYGFKGKYLELFAVGMLGALFYTHQVELKRLSPRIQAFIGYWSLLFACLGFIFCFLWAVDAGRLNNRLTTWYWAPAPSWSIAGEWAFGLCSVLLMLAALIGPARSVFAWMPLRRLGHISYSLFLIHFPIIMIFWPLLPRLTTLLGATAAYFAFLAAVVGSSVPIAALTFRFIEQPFLGRGAPMTLSRRSPAVEHV
jgi:peptidoglycan/LPS O-acetylase OafA/YrhL